MDKSKVYFEWMLLTIRMIVGVVLVIYGIKSIIAQMHTPNLFDVSTWPGPLYLLPIITPIIQIISGGLIATGVLIELGATLIIPVVFLTFMIIRFKTNELIDPIHFKYLLNLVMLAIAVGICGPGKWALWDPGKALRENIFE